MAPSVSPDIPDVSEQAEYSDDFEEDDEKEAGDDKEPAASLHRPRGDGLEEIVLCDAITPEALKGKG